MPAIAIFLLALLPIATVFLLLAVLERSTRLSTFVADAASALLVRGADSARIMGATVDGVLTVR